MLEPGVGSGTAAALAALLRQPAALLFRSTLHACWDVFAALGGANTAVLVDGGSYPIARFAAARATAAGGSVATFAHHSPADLRRSLLAARREGLRAVVVADGWCPGCGGPAPVAAYADLAERYGALVLLDDTQALGVFGADPSASCPYGRGGGGTLVHLGVQSSRIVVVASLAKGFGAPLAVLSGAREVIVDVGRAAEMRLHGSAPSAADRQAADRALRLNTRYGDRLRQRLLTLVRRFGRGLRALGLPVEGGLFPLQAVGPLPVQAARLIHRKLLTAGVRTVIQSVRCRPGAAVTFVFTAAATPESVDRALEALALARPTRPRVRPVA